MVLRRLLTTASLSAVSAILSRGSLFCGVLVLAMKLGPEGYGHFSLIQATALLFTTFCALSLGQMATKMVVEATTISPSRISSAFSVAYGSALVMSLPLVVLLASSGGWLAMHIGGSEHLAWSYACSALLVLTGFLVSVQNGVFLAINRTKSQALVNVWIAPLALAILIFAAYQESLLIAVLGYAASQALFVGAQELYLRQYRKSIGVRLSFVETTKEDWSILWKLGIPSSIAGLFVVVASWISMVLLSRSAEGVLGVGHFSLGNQARMILLFGVGVVANAALPMLTSAGADKRHIDARVIIHQSILLLLLVTASAALVITLVAYAVVPTKLPAYTESLPPLGWLLASVVVMAPTTIMMRKATADHRPHVLLVGNAVYSAVLLASTVIAMQQATGAAGLAFSYFVGAVAQLVAYMFCQRDWSGRAVR